MKLIFTILGLICLGTGTLGVIIPGLPTVPLFLAATVLLAKGSERFNNRFRNTKLYKKHLDSFVRTKGMTLKQKRRVLIAASIMLVIAFILCPHFIGRIIIFSVLALKYYFIVFRIKTLDKPEKKV